MKCLICRKKATMKVTLYVQRGTELVSGYYCTKHGEKKYEEVKENF